MSGRGRDSRSRSRSGGRSRSRERPRGEVSSEVLSLESSEIAYLLGRNGSTKQKIATFTGARLEIDHRDDRGRIEVIGTPEERDLARLIVDITLQQKTNQKMVLDFDKLEARKDIVWLDVPRDACGFVLGAKGATLRGIEAKYRTFMFFDTEYRRGDKRRLYIIGNTEGRKGALRECESAVQYKMSGNGSLRSWREHNNEGPRYTEDYVRRSRSRDRRRSRSPPRRRSRSRSRSPRRDRSGSRGRRRDERRSRSRSDSRGRREEDRR